MDADRPERGMARLVAAARERPAIALGVLVAVVLGSYAAVNALWRSEREVAAETIEAVLDALERGDADAVLEGISPYFSEGGVTKADLAKYLPGILERRPIRRTGLTVRQTKVAASKASLRVHVTSYHRGANRMEPAGSDWTVELERIGGRWMVRSASPIVVNGRRVSGLWAVLDLGL